LNTQVNSIELQDIQAQKKSARLWQVSQPALTADLALVMRPLSAQALRWRSAKVQRVTLPRLQFDKGLRIDVLA